MASVPKTTKQVCSCFSHAMLGTRSCQLTFTVTDGTQRETGLLAGEESSASVYLSVYHLLISKYSLSTYLSIICPVYLAQALWNDEL